MHETLGPMMLLLPLKTIIRRTSRLNARAWLHKSLKALSLTLLTLLPKTSIEMHYQRTSIHESLSLFFLATPCGMQNLSSCQRSSLCPLHRMHTVLTTGPLGKAPTVTFWKRRVMLANDVLTFVQSVCDISEFWFTE